MADFLSIKYLNKKKYATIPLGYKIALLLGKMLPFSKNSKFYCMYGTWLLLRGSKKKANSAFIKANDLENDSIVSMIGSGLSETKGLDLNMALNQLIKILLNFDEFFFDINNIKADLIAKDIFSRNRINRQYISAKDIVIDVWIDNNLFTKIEILIIYAIKYINNAIINQGENGIHYNIRNMINDFESKNIHNKFRPRSFVNSVVSFLSSGEKLVNYRAIVEKYFIVNEWQIAFAHNLAQASDAKYVGIYNTILMKLYIFYSKIFVPKHIPKTI